MAARKTSSANKGRGGKGRGLGGVALAVVVALGILAIGVVVGLALREPAPGAAIGRQAAAPARPAPPAPEPPPVQYEEPLREDPIGSLIETVERGETRLAALPTPPVPPPPPTQAVPAWQRFAVPVPAADGRPLIAVVIDDLGVDRKRSDKLVRLPGPLTTAFMAYARDLGKQAAAARARGHELLLHVPMEPRGASYDPGPNVLESGLPAGELRRRLALGLDRYGEFVGINNHMGSKFTADREGMAVVMDELRRRGLMFLDSVTTGATVGLAVARQHGVPAVARDVFLDNEITLPGILAQLDRAERIARAHGTAIAIGHPHDETIEALARWLPTLERKGLVLAPLSAVLQRRMGQTP